MQDVIRVDSRLRGNGDGEAMSSIGRTLHRVATLHQGHNPELAKTNSSFPCRGIYFVIPRRGVHFAIPHKGILFVMPAQAGIH
jgi:hypothetical protein